MVSKKSGEEEKVKLILTDPKLSSIKAMLEKDLSANVSVVLQEGEERSKETGRFLMRSAITAGCDSL